MFNSKNTKRALISSAIALIVCISMLIGSTYAWFTDSVTSNNNIIKSGNLDVEFKYSTDLTNWNDVTETTNIFMTDTLWEPGHTEVVYLSVKNIGSLDLKYQLGINIVSEIGSINKDNNPFKLSQFIDFGVKDPAPSAKYATAAEAIADVKAGAKKISEGFTKANELEANSNAEIVALVVYMPTTVTNEANYKTGEAIPQIKLGLNLVATQLASEYDSFGNQYDNIAIVSTADQLKAAVEAGGNVMLANNIAVTDLMMNVSKNVTTNLYLNGKTIAATSTTANRDGKEAVNSADNYDLFNVAAKGSLNIVGDGKITVNHTGAEMEWNAMTTAVHAYGDVTVSDGAEIINYGGTSMAFGLNAFIGGNITVKDSTIASAYRAIRVMNGTTSPSESTVDVSNSSLISYTHNAAFWHHADKTSGPVHMIGFATEADAIAAGNTIYGKVMDDTQDPETLWIGGEDGEYALVSTTDELKTALANGSNIVLANDLSLGYFVIDKDVVIDLNGNTFKATNNITLSDDAKLTMKGGNFVVDQTSAHINAGNGNVLTFEDVNCSYTALSRTNGSGGTNRLGSVFSIHSTKDGVKTVVEFKNCTLNNMQVSFSGISNCTGTIEATFESCTVDALTNSAPIYVNNGVRGTIKVTDCTFNIQATASDANAVWVNSTTSTAVTVVATNNTFNATKATPTDSSVTGVNVVKLSNTSFSNVSFIGNKGTTSSVTETGTIKTGIAK